MCLILKPRVILLSFLCGSVTILFSMNLDFLRSYHLHLIDFFYSEKSPFVIKGDFLYLTAQERALDLDDKAYGPEAAYVWTDITG